MPDKPKTYFYAEPVYGPTIPGTTKLPGQSTIESIRYSLEHPRPWPGVSGVFTKKEIEDHRSGMKRLPTEEEAARVQEKSK